MHILYGENRASNPPANGVAKQGDKARNERGDAEEKTRQRVLLRRLWFGRAEPNFRWAGKHRHAANNAGNEQEAEPT